MMRSWLRVLHPLVPSWQLYEPGVREQHAADGSFILSCVPSTCFDASEHSQTTPKVACAGGSLVFDPVVQGLQEPDPNSGEPKTTLSQIENQTQAPFAAIGLVFNLAILDRSRLSIRALGFRSDPGSREPKARAYQSPKPMPLSGFSILQSRKSEPYFKVRWSMTNHTAR
jgi:hypothetical protein